MIKKEGLFSNESMTRSDRSLHTPGSFAKQNLLYVQEVGRLESLTPHRCVREKLDSYLFLLVLEGSGELDVNGRKYAIKKGDAAFVDCMQHYEHISDEKDAWKLAWVHFCGSQARAYYDLFMKYNLGSNVFQADEALKFDDVVGLLLDKQNDKSIIAELKCGEILLGLVNSLIESVAKKDDMDAETSRDTAGKMREFLNENYADKNVLESLSEEFGMKLSQLNPIFGRFFGISIEEYVGNRRINAAKELLRFTIKPVEDVALESGIGDLVVFQQMFTSSEGMSAEEYRMKWAQWIR